MYCMTTGNKMQRTKIECNNHLLNIVYKSSNYHQYMVLVLELEWQLMLLMTLMLDMLGIHCMTLGNSATTINMY